MAFELPQRRALRPIQLHQREVPVNQIIQTLGENPIAQGITQAGNLVAQALQKRAQTKKDNATNKYLSGLTGVSIPEGTSPDAAIKGIAAKAEIDKANKPPANYVVPTIGPDGQMTFTPVPAGTKPTPTVKPPAAAKPGAEPTPIWQDPATGQVSGQEKSGWLKRTVPATSASSILASSFNQQANRDKPTAATKGSAEFANTILPHVDELRNLVAQADAAGFIGPVAGRVYGEFLAGKVGSTGNPEADRLLGRLRATDSLMKTGAMKVHFGSRGGQQMYDHFSDMLNTGVQSAATLNGALDGIESFMQGYSDAVPGAVGHNTIKPIIPKGSTSKEDLRKKLGL